MNIPDLPEVLKKARENYLKYKEEQKKTEEEDCFIYINKDGFVLKGGLIMSHQQRIPKINTCQGRLVAITDCIDRKFKQAVGIDIWPYKDIICLACIKCHKLFQVSNHRKQLSEITVENDIRKQIEDVALSISTEIAMRVFLLLIENFILGVDPGCDIKE